MNSKKERKNLGLLSLSALVVGSVIGSGVFNLMTNMSTSASLMAILIGWAITGVGMLFLVLCFLNLNKKRAHLDAGIYSYAEAGFGKFMGFNAAWGYWISAWVGNVAYATLMFSSLAYFFKMFDGGINPFNGNTFIAGQNIPSIIGASVVLWVGHFLILRGVKSASFTNIIVTAAKLIPIAIFILTAFIAFKLNIFTADIWGTATKGFEFNSVFEQVRSTMLVTVWVFIGIEGAVIFSGRAKKRKDVGRATILGFLTVLSIYLLVSVLSLGVKTSPELAALGQPGMATLLESIVGTWGAVLVNIGVIVSIAGAWLAWTMFAFELPYQAALKGTFPKVFALENKNGTPVVALTITNLLVQAFLFTFLIDGSAYTFAFSLATTTILVPYAFTAFYQLKYSMQEKAGTSHRNLNIAVGLVASIYAIWLVYAAGLSFLLLTSVIYAPGIVIFAWARLSSKKKKVFAMWEMGVALALVILCVYTIYLISTGHFIDGALEIPSSIFP
ncbi:MAG: basic amino acid/polyamine antiporter [Candidatus Saccharibacteria bacterium]|nr:basic amino acid/polyamine antiporter [Candidatus Saccharibacteria bacterium]